MCMGMKTLEWVMGQLVGRRSSREAAATHRGMCAGAGVCHLPVGAAAVAALVAGSSVPSRRKSPTAARPLDRVRSMEQ